MPLHFLTIYPEGFWLLGAVFLCTTGAEALYSDLGHCGRGNIRMSWIFVKSCLLINYLGQGAYLLAHRQGLVITPEIKERLNINAFYDLMPQWFVLIGVVIATTAAIIASQAMISGSFTLISEAMRLNLWPKLKIRYPSEEKGQLFIPGINALMFIGCVLVVLYFQKSSRMEAAYGLAIIVTMIATTVLFANYMVLHRTKQCWIYFFLQLTIIIELCLLDCLIAKVYAWWLYYFNGRYVYVYHNVCLVQAQQNKNRYIEFVRLEHYLPQIQELSNDKTVPKYATHLGVHDQRQ